MAPIFKFKNLLCLSQKKITNSKYGGYLIIVAHVVVDCKKTIIDNCIGLPRSVNDSQMLHMYAWYKQIRLNGLFDITQGCGNGILSYLLGDEGYPLINLIMTLFKEDKHHSILELLYNKKTQMSLSGG
jgi:hypothetical protein